jgi:hypothetical protein
MDRNPLKKGMKKLKERKSVHKRVIPLFALSHNKKPLTGLLSAPRYTRDTNPQQTLLTRFLILLWSYPLAAQTTPTSVAAQPHHRVGFEGLALIMPCILLMSFDRSTSPILIPHEHKKTLCCQRVKGCVKKDLDRVNIFSITYENTLFNRVFQIFLQGIINL